MKDMINHMQGLVLDNRYKVLEKIGVGGMADVYKGEDTLLGRLVAIKVLHQNFMNDEDFVARFKREAQAAGKLSHPNIVNMYDVGFDQGYHYLVMEYVEGETLKAYIRRHQHVSVDMAVKFTIAIAEGLEHAHAMGIVHCDIKPHNVLITPQGRVKVTDFGIARAMNSTNTLMYTNSIMGSAHYLSPEQASGKSINGSSDIYSLGVVLYEMLTGRVPYEGETPISVAIKHVKEPLTPPTRINPSIPPLLEAAVMKALAKDPANRFPTISDMISDLRLSQGFVNSKSGRIIPHDFATQVLPSMEDTGLDAMDYEEDETEEPSGWIAKIGQLPKKYIVLGSILIFLGAFLWAFFLFGNFWSNATVAVPNLVGKQVTVAQQILENNDLRYKVNKVSSDKPAGMVISQLPAAGERVKEQYPVVIVVSSGQGDITIPNLIGLKLEDAKSQILAAHLKIGSITYISSTDDPEGVILNQSPKDGNAVAGTMIDLVVSRKDDKKIVPNVVGSTVKAAKEAFASAQLTYTIEGPDADDAVIVKQNPAAASSIDAATKVIWQTELPKEKATTKGSNITRGTVDITVPNSGPGKQSVKLVVVDDKGSHVVYQGNEPAGKRITQDVQGVGNVRIEVYINGALVQDSSL